MGVGRGRRCGWRVRDVRDVRSVRSVRKVRRVRNVVTAPVRAPVRAQSGASRGRRGGVGAGARPFWGARATMHSIPRAVSWLHPAGYPHAFAGACAECG